jgi:predicted aconitase with swiveling domain
MTEWIRATGCNELTKCRSVTANTLVFKEPLAIDLLIDPNTGRITKSGHEHEGKSVKNKIIVAPGFAFNLDLEYLIYLLSMNKCSPKGVVVERASSNLILGSVLANFPLIYGFKEQIMDLVQNSYKITINLEKQSVKITKKK